MNLLRLGFGDVQSSGNAALEALRASWAETWARVMSVQTPEVQGRAFAARDRWQRAVDASDLDEASQALTDLQDLAEAAGKPGRVVANVTQTGATVTSSIGGWILAALVAAAAGLALKKRSTTT